MKKIVHPPLHEQLTEHLAKYEQTLFQNNSADADIDLFSIDRFISFTKQYRSQMDADTWNQKILVNQYEDFLVAKGSRRATVACQIGAVEEFLAQFELGEGRLTLLLSESQSNRSTLPEHLPPEC